MLSVRLWDLHAEPREGRPAAERRFGGGSQQKLFGDRIVALVGLWLVGPKSDWAGNRFTTSAKRQGPRDDTSTPSRGSGIEVDNRETGDRPNLV